MVEKYKTATKPLIIFQIKGNQLIINILIFQIMTDSIEERIIGDYLIKILQDNEPVNPREWDNIGTIICFHKKYSLGDTHDYNFNDFNSWEELKNRINKDQNVAVILPIYMYDHSGITIKTTPFSCPWDSGQIGFISISKEKVLNEFGGCKITKKLRERLTQQLIGEVETYDQYLAGDVYGYQITLNDEELDSCWGYYGIESCINEAKSIVKNYLPN